MPDDHTEERYLAAVGSHLDLPADVAQGVIDELAAHLRDTAEELQSQGLSPGDAERRAIDRLGDARELGNELSRVRHRRRQLLAAVGGGVWGLFVEGIKAYLVIAIVGFIAATLTLPIAGAVLNAQGRSASSLFGGLPGSVSTIVIELAVAAYLGRVLPARVAKSAVRSVRSVRRVVAVVGLVLGSAFLWFVPIVTPDPVLALGVPFLPFAFAAAALRAPDRPRFRPRAALAIAGMFAVLLAMLWVAVVSAAVSPSQQNWMADTATIGGVPIASDADVLIDLTPWYSSPQDVAVEFTGTAVPARFSTLRYELWPAHLEDGVVHFGNAPVVVGTAAVTANDVLIPYEIPRLRDPLTTATFIVGIGPDGERTLLREDIDFDTTPPWQGTLFEWWTGRP